jgi:hypothetical protein
MSCDGSFLAGAPNIHVQNNIYTQTFHYQNGINQVTNRIQELFGQFGHLVFDNL